MDTQDTQHNILDTLPTISRCTTLVDPPSDDFSEKVSLVPSYHYWRIASAILCLFAVGWGDGATGEVLPGMQSHFQLSFVMSSMLFVMVSAGCAFAAFFIEPLSRLLGRFHLSDEKQSFFPALLTFDSIAYSPSKGRHLILFISGFLHCIYFLFASCSPHYYGVLIAFFLGGIGKSILFAQAQAVIRELSPFNKVIPASILHRAYEIGALFSPLVSQAIRAHGYPWRGFFWISLGLAILNVGLSLYAFHTTEADFEREKSVAIETFSQAKLAAKGDIESTIQITDEKCEDQKGILSYVWVIATFIGLYQGVETISQGFIVTFLLHERNANRNVVGYALSGVWGGLFVGRSAWDFISTYSSQRVKTYYINFVLVLGIVFHVLIWRIDSMAANSVLVSLFGLITGPTFPLVLDIVTNQDTKQPPEKPGLLPVFPQDIRPVALVLFARGFGGAIFSLTAGGVATEYGAFAVEPLAMATLGFVLVFWVGVQIISTLVRK